MIQNGQDSEKYKCSCEAVYLEESVIDNDVTPCCGMPWLKEDGTKLTSYNKDDEEYDDEEE